MPDPLAEPEWLPAAIACDRLLEVSNDLSSPSIDHPSERRSNVHPAPETPPEKDIGKS
jgi:hypothetical protein